MHTNPVNPPRSAAQAPRHRVALGVLAMAIAATLSCAIGRGPASELTRWDYFAPPHPGDAWFEKIEDWQRRERQGVGAAVAQASPRARSNQQLQDPDEPLTLQQEYREQAQEEREELAQRLMTWAQTMAREHYRKDVDEVADPWPTTAELMAQGGDDCDGIDLLAYSMMRDFGFERQDLYRAIVRRDRDHANHMVTLWFQDRSDPWVVDATGAVSLGLKKFSQVKGWQPRRVFNEYEQFSVVEVSFSASD
jgi:predicted transglutaminase-like cysteine proteinase